jgi:hypothetical protein
MFLSNLTNALMILLIGSAVVSLALNEIAEGIAILVTVLANVR